MNHTHRSNWLYSLAGIAICLLSLIVCSSAFAADNALESINYHALSHNRVVIRLTFAHAAPVPKVLAVSSPARLSLDFNNTALAAAKHYQKINIGAVRSVAAAADANRTRVVVAMSQLMAYKIGKKDNVIRIRLRSTGATTGSNTSSHATAASGSSETTASNARPAGPGPRITDIDFRRNAQGGGRVLVDIANINAPVSVSRQGNRVVATFPAAELPASLVQRLDVIDFATPVQYIDARPTPGGAEVDIIATKGADFKQVAYQTDSQLVVTLQPLTKTGGKNDTDKPEFTGKPISLSFQNLGVRVLLQMIASNAGLNMVIADSVKGTMALELDNVPYDQALDIILQANGLGMRKQGNVIMVAPLASIAKQAQLEQQAKHATTNAAPLITKVIQVNYADATALATLFDADDNSSGSDSASSDSQSLLSPRGSVTAVERTNMLLVTDTRKRVAKIKRLVKQLDTPVRQVLIQARIVVANRKFSRNLGVKFGATDTGSFEGAKGENFVTNSGFSVGLPVAGAAGTIATSIVGDTFSLNLALSAMESENKGEIISSPRVITTDGQEGHIEQGREVPYVTSSGDNGTNTQFKDVKLELGVTPRITPNGNVIMELQVTQDTVGELIQTTGGLVPSINTRSLNTTILVKGGETVVLGGIYVRQNIDVTNSVPVLGDIPLIGALFRSTSKQHNKRELLIFVTPKILKGGLTPK